MDTEKTFLYKVIEASLREIDQINKEGIRFRNDSKYNEAFANYKTAFDKLAAIENTASADDMKDPGLKETLKDGLSLRTSDIFTNIADLCRLHGGHENSMGLLNQAVKYARNDNARKGKAVNHLGLLAMKLYFSYGHEKYLNAAIKKHGEALRFYDAIPYRTPSEAMDTAFALDCLVAALSKKESNDDLNLAVVISLKASRMYESLEKEGYGKDEQHERISLIHRFGNNSHTIAGIYEKRGELDEAEKKYLQALKKFEDIGFERGIAGLHAELAGLYLKKNDIGNAHEHYADFNASRGILTPNDIDSLKGMLEGIRKFLR